MGGSSIGSGSSASTSGGGGIGGSGGDDPGQGRKCGCDDDQDDDPNKRGKTNQPPKPPRQPMARKEPQKGQPMYGGQYIVPGVQQGVTYPPIDRNLALCVTSQREDPAGLPYTGLDQGSIGEDAPGEIEGQTDQATQIPSWNSGIA